jgi:hypothetical protein
MGQPLAQEQRGVGKSRDEFFSHDFGQKLFGSLSMRFPVRHRNFPPFLAAA